GLLWGVRLARRRVVRLPGGRVATLLLMGCLFSSGSVTSFMAVERIPASLAALIFYLNPVIVTVFSTLLYKTPFTRARLGVLIASLVGCALTTNIESGDVNLT